MDRLLLTYLLAFGRGMLSKLTIQRLSPGRYEVDGRRISLCWGPHPSMAPMGSAELYVREDEVGGDVLTAAMMPLHLYLEQAANVAESLRGRVPGAPVVARIPEDMRLTFGGTGEDALDNLDVLQRCESMRKACEEARLREKAAEALVASWRPPAAAAAARTGGAPAVASVGGA